MKKLIFPFVAMATIISFLTGCSEKFDVAAPYKDITVIYGFLEASDTAHYIRIQKAFLDQNKSAVNMAQSSDSNFFNNINVRIARFSILGNHNFKDTIHLNRVDLTAEGYPKQAGTFFNAPNYAYKFTNSLDRNYIYRIYVTHLNNGHVDSADAPIIEDRDKNVFSVPMIDDNDQNLLGLSFFSVIGRKFVDLSGNYIASSDFTDFSGNTTPVGVSQLYIRFNWVDSEITTHAKTAHSYDLDAGLVPTVKGGFEYKVENNSLYAALRTGMGVASSTTYRLLDRCDIIVYLSTFDYYQYNQVSLTQGTGLTGSEIQPVYTNVKGENVLGLFTSRALRQGKITITPRTIDSLKASPLLTDARIMGTVY